jgi:hypothetical protein
MAGYEDLQIHIVKPDANSFLAYFQMQDPSRDSFLPPTGGVLDCAPDNLIDYLSDAPVGSAAYGRKLCKLLFTSPEGKSIGAKLVDGRANLRLRLSIDRSAAELSQLAWEAIRKPATGGAAVDADTGHPDSDAYADTDADLLAADEHILLSRLLPALGRVPSSSHSRDNLRALVVIASPSNLVGSDDLDDDDRPGLHLAPIDVELEKSLALEGLNGLGTTPDVLASNKDQPGLASLTGIREKLREGFDILYIVCHGALGPNPESGRVEPYLWLEKDASDEYAGRADRVPGDFLIKALSQLDLVRAPRLIVLCSCQSAGQSKLVREAAAAKAAGKASDDFELGFVALGPLLASRIVPAVVAMTGNISMETAHVFMPEFFAQLREHGQIDRAMAAARGKVHYANRYDDWRLVLFMSLKSGLVWYTPRFSGDTEQEEIWQKLVTPIQLDRCLPILGPGLVEPLFGTRREMARSWTDLKGYPLAERDTDVLPIVGQYLTQAYGTSDLRWTMLPEYIKARLTGRLPTEVLDQLKPPKLAFTAEIFKALGATLRAVDSSDAHYVLAHLPISIYLTTNSDDLLADALRACGKEPQVFIQRWKQVDSTKSAINLEGPKYVEPSCRNPLVYHIYGHISDPDSLVLTEDDYFDFLMLVNSEKNRVLSRVRAELNVRSLLFLGFEMDDWPFRVLFRSILSDNRRRERSILEDQSIAVQVSPEESVGGPERARRYLEKYFLKANIECYWGTATDFVHGLWDNWPTKDKLCEDS